MLKQIMMSTVLSCLPASQGTVCTFGSDGRCQEQLATEATMPVSAEATVQPATSVITYRYAALVAGLKDYNARTGEEAHVLTASARGATPADAVAKARELCEEPGLGNHLPGRQGGSREGCWYVANGTRGTQARYVTGRTWGEAFASCEQGGFTCSSKRMGGCMYGGSAESDESEQDE